MDYQRALALVLLSSFALAPAGAAERAPAEGLAAPHATGGNRIWVETIQDNAGRHASLALSYPPRLAPGDPFVVEWTVRSRHRFDNVSVSMLVRGANDRPFHEGSVQVALAQGDTDGRCVWDPWSAPPGVYTIEIAALRAPEGVLASTKLRARVLNGARLEDLLRRAGGAAVRMRDHLSGLAARGYFPPYAEVKTRIAEDFAQLATTAAGQGDWPTAEAYALYVLTSMDSVRAALTFGGFDSQLTKPVRSPDLSGLAAAGPELVAEGRPVVLVGISGIPITADLLAQMARYGLNHVVAPIRSTTEPVAPESLSPAELSPLLEAAARYNVSVTAQHVGRTPTDGRAASGPVEAQLQQLASAALARELVGRPMLHSLSVARGPRFRFGGESVRQGFVADVESRYPDLFTLNRLWRARLSGFDAIELAWDLTDSGAERVPSYTRNRPYRFDWLSHHLRLGTDLTARRLVELREAAPGLPLQMTFEDATFELDEAIAGIDEETMAPLFDRVGVAVTVRGDDEQLAMGYPEPNVMYTLLRSLAPDRPLYVDDLALHIGDDPYAADLYDVTYTSIWEAAVRGVIAVGVHVPANAAGLTAPGSPFAMPDVLDAAATARLDLNRLAPELAAFRVQQAEVAILWSRSSRIYDGGNPFLQSVLNAYEGASFFGRPIRFITEEQCANGTLDRVQALILADTPSLSDPAFDAIARYVAQGGVLLRHPRPAPYNELGLSRLSVLDRSDKTFLVRGEGAARAYLLEMDAVEASGLLEPRPRLTNHYGYPIEGVSTRVARREDGVYLLYCVNLRPEGVEVQLKHDVQTGRDLISDTEVRFPLALETLQPMLVRLDPSPAPEASATEAEAPGELPTATVGPIPEPAETPRPFPVPERRRGSRPAYLPAHRPVQGN